MHVSLKWLAEYVKVPDSVEELVHRLEMTGTAVEGTRVLGKGLEGIVVGRVLEIEPHPRAERLRYCSVDTGFEEPLRIVCGATNFEVGSKVPVARVGSRLPNGLMIKRSKIRGLASEGMMCSAAELGVGSDSQGILILPDNAQVGVSYAEFTQASDTIVDLEITPNRPDCLSMMGIAREVAAITGTKVRSVTALVPECGDGRADERVSVEIAEPGLCTRYTARYITGVKVAASSPWLQERIVAAGARPVNNVVDITNYVMFETGQPLHAFDARELVARDGHSAITVRLAREGETLLTLDGVDRALAEDMLVIADDAGPVALAGVMGGASSEVSERTVDIVLESACFDPVSVGFTSRSLGLISESSTRFERGVDPNGCAEAIDRAAALIVEVAGGTIVPGRVDVYPAIVEPRRVTVRLSKINALLGTTMEFEEVISVLDALGFAWRSPSQDEVVVTVPTSRPDIEREVDVIEEVVRVWGMERVPATLPGGAGRIGSLTERQRWLRRIHGAMRAAGLNETMTYSFVDPRDRARTGAARSEAESMVALVNPMSEEQSVMRWSLLPGLLRTVSHNQRHAVTDVHVYEVGTVFFPGQGSVLPSEKCVLAGALAGSWAQSSWNDPGFTLDFFDGKGVVETLLAELGAVEDLTMKEATHPWLQPGRSADVCLGAAVVGWLGEVHPDVAHAFEVEVPVVVFELDVDALIAAAPAVRTCEKLPRYPAVRFDLAIIASSEVSAGTVEQAIRAAGGPLLESVRLFDVYEGGAVGEGKRSLAWELVYRAPDRTLADEEIRPVHERLVRKVCAALGVHRRGDE